MPSPVGHVLGGMTFGWLVAGSQVLPPKGGSHLKSAAVFGILGALPDIDFAFGAHSTYTHSVGACLVAGLAAWIWLKGRARLAIAATAAYGSHLLLDWLGDDTTPPIGIMALWPITDGFYQSNLHLFMAISRRYWLSNFWPHNLQAVAWEIAILAPLAAAVWWLRIRPSSPAGPGGADSVTSISFP